MSLFRPPQVPQQPARFFTPGQPLGIPAPRVDAQMVQFEAYYRQHVEIQQPQIFKTSAAPATFVAPPALQIPASQRWALEWIVENYWAEFTPGTALGVPQPRQSDQVAAYYRQHVEIPQPVYSFTFTPVNASPPRQTDQAQAAWRQRIEIAQPVYFATVGQALGTPNPVQSDQTQAMWRQRLEIPQPVYFAPIPAPTFYAPRYEYQMAAYFPPHPITVEYLDQQLVTEFTQGTPLGIPQPKQTEQTAAYWRQRIEAIQPVTNPVYPLAVAPFVPASVVPIPQNVSWRFEWLIDFLQPEFVPQQLSGFVPPIALQMPFAAQRNEWSILLQQRITAGIALGIPRPRQSDQTAAYYRQHVEIQQPIYFALIPAIPLSLRRDEFTAGRDRIRYTVVRDNVEFSVPREQVKFKPT